VLTEEEKKALKAARMKVYFERDPERWRAVRAAKYAARRGIELANSRAWREANKQRVAEYDRGRDSRDRRLQRKRTRRARLLAAPGRLSLGIDQRLFAEQGGACAHCGVVGAKLELDHKIPLSRGGANSDENVQLLCRRCNASKGNRDAPSTPRAV